MRRSLPSETNGLRARKKKAYGVAAATSATQKARWGRESLDMVLEKSQTIDELIESISQSTVSQADTSRDVTKLMEKIAQLSETTSQSSEKVARSIVETARVAQKLESAVAQFKVAESAVGATKN